MWCSKPRHKRGEFSSPRRKHLHQRLAGVDNLLSGDYLAQGINQWLKLYTRLANPLSQS